MTRNFKTLEVGKTYVSALRPNTPVRIYGRDKEVFFGNNDSSYKPDGRHDCPDMNLTTEVTVTITPVEPPKQNAEYGVFLDDSDQPIEVFDSPENASRFMRRNFPKASFVVREIIDGEE